MPDDYQATERHQQVLSLLDMTVSSSLCAVGEEF